jgi:hypothetical protein
MVILQASLAIVECNPGNRLFAKAFICQDLLFVLLFDYQLNYAYCSVRSFSPEFDDEPSSHKSTRLHQLEGNASVCKSFNPGLHCVNSRINMTWRNSDVQL